MCKVHRGTWKYKAWPRRFTCTLQLLVRIYIFSFLYEAIWDTSRKSERYFGPWNSETPRKEYYTWLSAWLNACVYSIYYWGRGTVYYTFTLSRNGCLLLHIQILWKTQKCYLLSTGSKIWFPFTMFRVCLLCLVSCHEGF